jgi:Dyp-type peroxidase family
VAELKPEDMEDIQGFVMSGYAHLACVSYRLLRVDDKVAARRWLTNLTNEVTTSEGKQEISCLNVALTHHGLAQLGLTKDALDSFSLPFIEGMATPHRSRILGDSDENEPARWDWGSNDASKAVDVLLLLFGKDEQTLDDVIRDQSAKFTQNGLTEILALGAGRQPDSHEHFGFADGMGQPAIEGTFQTRDAPARNVIKAGEILLSYINDYDQPANSPTVSLASDKNGLLPHVIEGTTDDPSTKRDLGRNGTYVVFRQLRQHPARLYHYLDEATRKPDGQLDPAASARLAAKMVGRWPEGAPLVLSPDGDNPALGTADDFGFRDSDARGFKCPIGSHIRRSNPRDSLGPDGPTATKTANRHRILRRGRSYGHRPADRRVDDGIDRGLHFLCLNSDIERQFEFVQQTWINNPVFGGLNGEVDPLIGNINKTEAPAVNPNPGPDNGDAQRDAIFTVQADPLRTRVHNLERFVTVKGGAYFFLPSIRALRYLASL